MGSGRSRRVGVGAIGAILLTVTACLLPATPAFASWSASGSGSASATTASLSAPTAVSVPATSTGDVAVSWTASTGTVVPTGYYVTRTSSVTTSVCGSGATALLHTTSCTDSAVAEGTYTYTVVAVYRSWTAASGSTGSVAVAPIPSGGPGLGVARTYSVYAGTAVVNTGASTLSGDLGAGAADSVTGFPPGEVSGEIHDADATTGEVASALETAYSEAAARTPDAEIAGDLNGLTLSPGVYHAGAALALTGTVTLDAHGDPNAVFLFQVGAALNTGAASSLILAGGARASNVFWQVEGAAGTGAASTFAGTILAYGAITLGASSTLIGRALSAAAVTLADNTIRFTASPSPTIGIDGGTAVTTQDTTPTVTGTSSAPAGSAITVTLAGQVLTTTVRADARWTVTAATLPAGAATVVARVRDAAGNGARATQALIVEVDPAPLDLRSAATYSVLAATSVVNSGATTLSGDLGVSPSSSVTGFGPGTVDGTIHAGDAAAATAQSDIAIASTDGRTRVPDSEFSGDVNGTTMHMGVHHTSAAFSLTGTLTLDAQGNPDAVFIIQVDAALTTAASSSVLLVDGAQASNVFWIVTGAVGTGASSSIAGSILATGAITLGADSHLDGRALSGGTITLATNTLTGAKP